MSFARLMAPVRARLRLPVLALAFVLLGALIGLSRAGAAQVSLAGASATGGKIHACVAVPGGAVAFIAVTARCPKGTKSLIILQKAGPRGARGKTGAQGKQGIQGIQGIQGVPGPTGPANTEVVSGPVVTLTGGNAATGQTATSSADCADAVDGANGEAYGGGVVITPHPLTVPDVVSVQASYPGHGSTGVVPLDPIAKGAKADGWTGTAVAYRLTAGDTATVQAYVICGP